MYYGFLQFDSIPEIGFAHHFESAEYQIDYTGHQKNFEIVCNIKGDFRLELYDRTYHIKEGSIFLVFRNLPIRLTALNKEKNEHYTVQLEMEYQMTLQKNAEPPPDEEGILLPLIIPPGNDAEWIRKELISIILGIERDSGRSTFGMSLRVLKILQKMDAYARNRRKKLHYSPSFEKISQQVKQYIKERLDQKITLAELAKAIGKTPNYINHAFREINEITINRYINREKILAVARRMQEDGIPFEKACESIGLTDLSYGYRLFKRHMGVTPGQYQKGKIFSKSKKK